MLTNEQESTLELVRSLLIADGLAEYAERLDASEAAAPVAWMVLAANTRKPCEVTLYKSETEALRQDCVVPLYATPQPASEQQAARWLSDFEIMRIAEDHCNRDSPLEGFDMQSIVRFARALLAAKGDGQ